MKKLRLRFPINIQISIFLVLVAFIPVAAMMMLKTYESQMLTMMENSNVQQARIVSASLALSGTENTDNQINPDAAKKLLQNMDGKFDARIRILFICVVIIGSHKNRKKRALCRMGMLQKIKKQLHPTDKDEAEA